MQFNASTPLKALDLTARPGVYRAGAMPTKLTPADLSGVISHTKHKPATASLAAAAAGAKPIGPVDGATRHEQLVSTTQKWVAQTFFGTLLKQMRESPFKSDLFSGGRGGQAFSELYDQRLIDHMSRGSGKKIVNALVRRIEARNNAPAAYGKQNRVEAPAGASGARTGGDSGSDATHAPPTVPVPVPQRAAVHAASDATNPYRNVRVNVSPAL